MNISVVIPNYNGADLLKNNLPKVIAELEKYKMGKTEVIVSDDCSTDDSILVLNKFSNIKILKNIKNLGFSSNVNNAVQNAHGDLILLLNTDVYPSVGFLDPLLDYFKDDKVFAVGCMDKSLEDNKLVLRGRGIGSWIRGFLIHKRGEIDKNDTLWVSGGSGIFRKKIWDKLGGLNSLYNPFYWEDIDLSYRAIKSGYKIFFEPKSIVWHDHEKGVIKSKFKSLDIKKIAYRNQIVFAWINLTDLDLIVKHFIWLPYHFIKAIVNNDTAFLSGIFNALKLLPKIIKFRIENKKLFVKKDREVVDLYNK